MERMKSKVLISRPFSFCLCSIVYQSASVKNLTHEHQEHVLVYKSWRVEASFNRQERILREILSTLYRLSVCDKADFKNNYIMLSNA